MGIRHLLLVVVCLVGCGGETAEEPGEQSMSPVLTADTLGEQTVLSNAEYLASERYTAADRKQGAQQAQICRACHSLDKGGSNTIGPALYGFFGREAGSVDNFAYSPALDGATFIWTPRAMDAWLAAPAQFLPGNRMTIAGVKDRTDRDALVAYLLEVTDSK